MKQELQKLTNPKVLKIYFSLKNGEKLLKFKKQMQIPNKYIE